jgi:hypothetical protein
MATTPFIASGGAQLVVPIEPAVILSLDAKEDKNKKGVANGYAPLDSTSKVPLANLPPIDVSGSISTHNSATTSVHGIANTANLVTTSNLATHTAVTTSIHGIANTANLVLTDDSRIVNIAGGSINTSGGSSNEEYGTTGGNGGSIDLRGGNGGEDGSSGAGGSIQMKGADGNDGMGGAGGSILMNGAIHDGHSGSINLSATPNANGGSINLSAGASGPYSSGAGGSITSIGSAGTDPETGQPPAIYGGGSLIMSAGINGAGGSINTSDGGGSINTSNIGGSILLNGFIGDDNIAGGGSIDLRALSDEGNGGSIIANGKNGFNGGTINISGGINGVGGSINLSNGGGSINLLNEAGSINTSNGGGSINTSNIGGLINLSTRGGSINLSGNNENTTTGGSIASTASTDYDGGSLNMSAGGSGAGGSVNLSDGGGSIDTSGGANGNGGSINTSNGGGSINLSAGGGINLSNKGGYIKSTGGGDANISGNTGGSIDLSCAPNPIYYGATGGSINLTGGEYGRAGNISSTGGYGDNNERGGDLDMSGKSRRGGDILTHGGDYDGSEDGYGLGAEGGDILTYGGQYNGGSINTSNGGGSINTRGVGSVQLGHAGTRTTLNGSASGSDKTITLPNATGTIALTSDSRFTDARTPTSTLPHTHGNITNDGKVLVPYGGILSATGVDAGSFSNGTFPMIQGSGAGGVITILNGVISVTSAGSGYVDGGATKAGGSRFNLVTQSTQNASANLPVITTTGGNISAGSFGTTANTFCQGNDTRLSRPYTLKTLFATTTPTTSIDVKYFSTIEAVGAVSALELRNFQLPYAFKVVACSATIYNTSGAAYAGGGSIQFNLVTKSAQTSTSANQLHLLLNNWTLGIAATGMVSNYNTDRDISISAGTNLAIQAVFTNLAMLSLRGELTLYIV